MQAFSQTLAAAGRERIGALATLGRRLVRDRRGNILMITGFALIPITFSTGMVVDYSRAARLQTKLNAVADASSLAATTTPMLKKTQTYACNAALNAFINGSAGLSGLTLSTVSPADLRITLDETYASGDPQHISCQNTQQTAAGSEIVPLSRVANVTYAGKSANAFGGILGRSTIDIGGTSSSKVTAAPFIDIHLALDTSQSMGLAATDADATALWNRTLARNGEGCTFGCHVPGPGKPYANEDLANNPAYGPPIRLRVNVLRDATADMIQTAIANQQTANNYRFGLYRIGATLTDIQALTSDLATAKATANTVTLGPNNSSGVGDTNLPDTMTNMMSRITAHGDGRTQASARAFLFLITDGVTDVAGSCTYGHCTRPIAPATCQAYKDAGITVGVVYTTYLPVRSNPLNPNDMSLRAEYTNLIKSFSWPGYTSPNPSDNSADIAPALRACASNGWFFEASDGPSIHAAMLRLFSQASQTPTIIR